MTTPCYCSALRAAARKTSALYDEALAPAGLSVAQFSMMRKIARAAPVSLTALATLCALDRSTVGRNVKGLERRGLVAGTESDDHREAALVLTDAGKAALEAAAPQWEAAQARIEAALGDDGAGRLRALLDAL